VQVAAGSKAYVADYAPPKIVPASAEVDRLLANCTRI
jgi:hypothetical protein